MPFLKKKILKKQLDLTLFPPNLVKMSANLTNKHICNIINVDINNYNVPDNLKVATVRPLHKRRSRNKLKNYRRVSLLNSYSKIYERYIRNSITSFVNNRLFVLISAYRKSYSSNHVLIRLVGNWKKSLDNKKFV